MQSSSLNNIIGCPNYEGALHLFANLSEVREIIHEWMISYNEERPHASLGNLPPKIYKQ